MKKIVCVYTWWRMKKSKYSCNVHVFLDRNDPELHVYPPPCPSRPLPQEEIPYFRERYRYLFSIQLTRALDKLYHVVTPCFSIPEGFRIYFLCTYLFFHYWKLYPYPGSFTCNSTYFRGIFCVHAVFANVQIYLAQLPFSAFIPKEIARKRI